MLFHNKLRYIYDKNILNANSVKLGVASVSFLVDVHIKFYPALLSILAYSRDCYTIQETKF